jgi:AhpD family alkylhydroperoxidase
MPRIPPVDRSRLDAETLALLKAKIGGSRWNVFEGIANHAPSLRGMFSLREAMDEGLRPFEHEVIAIEVARFNGCGYCLPAHRFVCSEIGIDADEIESLCRGELLETQPSLMAIQLFVRATLEKKGKLDDAEFNEFLVQGITEPKMIVILSEIALYTLLNYFNRLAGTEIETQVLPYISEGVNWITKPDR